MLGAVLAGGASRRFGAPKTLAVIAGEPLLARPLLALRAATGRRPILVCKQDTPLPPIDAEVVFDSRDEAHPAAGLLAALAVARARGGPSARVLVLAGDMPGVRPDPLRALIEDGPGLVCATADGDPPGPPEPLCAVWPQEAAPELERALDSGLPLAAVVEALDPVTVPIERGTLMNVNRPEELEGP